jgi:hypothetical protein
MKRAIVTLAIGEKYLSRWQKLCQQNWKAYGSKHGIDIVVLDKCLDDSPRAAARSAAWQKCLVFDQPEIQKYDRVAWIDTDIFFNVENAPDIFTASQIEKVGAVNSFEDPSFKENQIALLRLWDLINPEPEKSDYFQYRTPEDIYRAYGDPIKPLPFMLNAGVLVASPEFHRDVFRKVYEYEDRGPATYYENVPLSYELVVNNLVHWIDPRFNHLWTWSKLLHYPFLMGCGRTFKDKILRHAAKAMGNDYESRVKSICASTALMNCYCLHFAGYAKEMECVDFSIVKRGVGFNLGIR